MINYRKILVQNILTDLETNQDLQKNVNKKLESSSITFPLSMRQKNKKLS